MPKFHRISLAALAALPLAASAVAAPVTLTDAGTTVVIDPASQDGISVWEMNGVDHVKKSWYWLFGEGFEGSMDQLTLDSTVVTDSDGDGDDDTLVAHYTAPDDQFSLEVAWRLQDQGLQVVGPPATRHSSLVTQISFLSNTGDPDTGQLDVNLIHYVDMDLGADPFNERLIIGPDQPTPFAQPTLEPYNHAWWNLVVQERFADAFATLGAGYARYRAATAARPPQLVDGAYIADADFIGIDVSEYPTMLTALNTPGGPLVNLAAQGFDGDLTYSYLTHIDTGGGNSHGVTFVEELEASILGLRLPDLPVFLELYLSLVDSQALQPVGPPFQLGLFNLVLQLAVFFDQAGADGAKCALLEVADRRSDGDPQPGDWLQGKGLPILQQALEDTKIFEGCNGGKLPPLSEQP
jgi:hypothetical protein